MIHGEYKAFYEALLPIIPKERMFHDALSTLAYGTDASFYRLIPKLVIRARNEQEIAAILQQADRQGIPVTFRAAGTSLSGQALSDSVLVIVSHGWQGWQVLDEGRKIRLQPGIRGGRANTYLVRYGRKIGPDPASIDSENHCGHPYHSARRNRTGYGGPGFLCCFPRVPCGFFGRHRRDCR